MSAEKPKMTTGEWLRSLPLWFQVVYWTVSLPAWLVVAFCVVTGQNKSPLAIAAGAVFATTVLIGLGAGFRNTGDRREGGGISFGGGDA